MLILRSTMRIAFLFLLLGCSSAFAQNPCLLLSNSSTSAPVGGGNVTVALNSLTGQTCSFATPVADVPWITAITAVPPIPNSAGSLTLTLDANPTGVPRSGHVNFPGQAVALTITQQGTGALRFVPIVPCRVTDTRLTGATLTPNSSRDIPISSPTCPVLTGAQAFAVNITAIPKGPLSYLTVWPTGQDRPFVSTLNSASGTTVANGAIIPSGTNRSISVFSTDATDVVIDLEGYFVAATSPVGLSFYPVTPCRVTDTRPDQTLASFVIRSVTIAGTCGVPTTAKAFALNFTAVPKTVLSYFSAWPGGSDPFISVMNSNDGRTLANNAIIASASNGSITMYGSQATDVIVDVNGYFADPGSPGALDFYPLAPCRIADTRLTFWLPPPAASRDFDVIGAGCGVPTAARAYAVNITAVPVGPLSFLTAYPTGSVRPFVSTLNAGDGRVTANGALLPGSANNSISVYTSSAAGGNVVIDVNGYFAP